MVSQRVRQAICNRAAGCTAHPRSVVGHEQKNSPRPVLVRSTSVSGTRPRPQTLPGRAMTGLVQCNNPLRETGRLSWDYLSNREAVENNSGNRSFQKLSEEDGYVAA